jgi:hypothetical protein
MTTPLLAEASASPPRGRYSSPPGSPRDVAVGFFTPLAQRLDSGVATEPITLPFWPIDLAPALRRPLERAALTLGANLQRLDGPRLVPSTTPLTGSVAASLTTFPPAGEGFYQLPGGPPPPAYGAGAFRPGVILLVGDRSNVARIGQLKHRLPFVTFAGKGGVGPWINTQLEAALISEDELYWINAYDAAGAATDPSLIAALQPGHVVALGRLAERWCVDAGARHTTILSPYDWRQQGLNKPYPLGRLLRELLTRGW